MDDTCMARDGSAGAFAIFRMQNAPNIEVPNITGMAEVARSGLRTMVEEGSSAGNELKVLFNAPGFNLTYAWFKSGYPLMRHSHSVDCLYLVMGGSLRLGDETLHKGDGFFVPANAPYVYTIGPQGVEILEIRHENCHDLNMMANNATFWAKAVETVKARGVHWKTEPKPV
jgi:hypothetical protein